MKFVAVEDIAAPLGQVWPHVADFEGFERRASRRAGPVIRTPPGPPVQGTVWRGRTEVMGRARDLAVTLTDVEKPARIVLDAATDGMSVTIVVELTERAPRLTRLTVTTEATARSLAARLMLQSAKLARQTLAKRYRVRVSDFANAVEEKAAKG